MDTLSLSLIDKQQIIQEKNKNSILAGSIQKYAASLRLVFLLFFNEYIYIMLHTFHNMRSNLFLAPEAGILHYRMAPLAYADGLLVFGLIFSLKMPAPQRLNRLAGAFTLLSVPFIYLMFSSDTAWLYLLSYYLLMFFTSFGCVYIYDQLAGACARTKHTGMIFFSGCALSTVVQYLLQIVIAKEEIILYSLLMFSFILAFLEFAGRPDTMPRAFCADAPFSDQKTFALTLGSTLVIIILLEAIGNFLTYSLLERMYEGDSIAFASPRLFFLLSFFLMGLAAEIKDMKFLPVLTFAGVLAGILNPILSHENSGLYLNTCIYYVTAGMINSFYLLSMWRLARGKRFAPLIAVSGLFIDKVFSFIFISPAISDLSLTFSVGLELVMIIAIMLILVVSGQLSFDPPKTVEADPIPRITPEEFAKKYNLSQKETELLEFSISFDGNMAELAKELLIARSVLYRRIQNIMKKTGKTNFQSVKNLYHQECSGVAASAVTDLPKADDANAAAIKSAASGIKTEDQIDPTAADEAKKPAIKTVGTADPNPVIKKTDYHLTENELTALKLYLENPGKTQKELAEMQGINLRTMQRRLSEIRKKTGASSLKEVYRLFSESKS